MNAVLKKFLPTFSLHERGFTLVELLVVIAIIAILSTIGFTLYGTVQKNARDTKRKADIDAISKVMEVNYNNSTPPGNPQTLAPCSSSSGCPRAYCGLRHAMFIPAIPSDPINTGTSCSGNECKYCVRTSVGTGNCGTNDPRVDYDSPVCGTSYIICANLETNTGINNQNYYCRSNQL